MVKNLFIFTETGGLVKPDTVRTEFKFWVFSLLPGFCFIWPLCLFHTGIGINFINFERVLLLHKLIFFFFFFLNDKCLSRHFKYGKKSLLFCFCFCLFPFLYSSYFSFHSSTSLAWFRCCHVWLLSLTLVELDVHVGNSFFFF